ncbi:MAG: hypothetical protein AABY18_09650 [Candidatus Thermoplasmatota archaeon]
MPATLEENALLAYVKDRKQTTASRDARLRTYGSTAMESLGIAMLIAGFAIGLSATFFSPLVAMALLAAACTAVILIIRSNKKEAA